MTKRSTVMPWFCSNRADPRAANIADRHYNRQKVGSPQFVPPGRCIVLLTKNADAVWVTSWPFAEYVKHAWAGAWVNSLYRNECPLLLSSDGIVAAVACTRWRWPNVPEKGMVTFVDPSKIRHKRDPGRCYLRAGFSRVGETAGGLLTFQMLERDMPEATAPRGTQISIEVDDDEA